MLERVESDELTEMLVEMDAYPWGEVRDDWRSAHQVTATLAAAGAETSVADNLLQFDEPLTEEESEAALVEKIKLTFALLGASMKGRT